MTHLTLEGIRQILGDQNIKFMRKGRSGKAIHLSDGFSTNANLLCGVTYSRRSLKESAIFPVHIAEIEAALMCKNCLSIVHNKVTPIN